MNTKNENAVINDKKLESVSGGANIEFTDSDDYEHQKAYEKAYKFSKKESLADAAPTADEIISELRS